MKRTPELYKKEFATHMETFKTKLADYKENPAKKNEELIHYMLFFAHVSIFMEVNNFRLELSTENKSWNFCHENC